MRIIDGKALAAKLREQIAQDVRVFQQRRGGVPGLATILVGDNAASGVYVAAKQRACAEVGMASFDKRLPATATAEQVRDLIRELNVDETVDGILLQLPLPDHLDADELTGLIEPTKDVDGLTPTNAGLLAVGRPGLRPCTPQGVMELLASIDVPLDGARAVVVGRSNLFGKPMAQLLLEANATVTILPLAYPRSERGLCHCRHPHRRRRPSALDHSRVCEARRHRDRRWHQPPHARGGR